MAKDSLKTTEGGKTSIGHPAPVDPSIFATTATASEITWRKSGVASITAEEPKMKPNENEKKLLAEKVYRCFTPYIIFGYAFLRFPLQGSATAQGYIFHYNKKSIPAIGFIITSTIVAVTAALFFMNTIGSALDYPPIHPNPPNDSSRIIRTGNYRFEELYILRRNIIPLIMLISSLCHATVGSWQFFKMRHFAASYFTFWTEIVEIINIDVAEGVKRYMTIVLSCYGGFLVIFFVVCAMGFAPVASGGPAILGMLCVRCFYPRIHTHSNFWVLRGFGGFLFFYILICSKTFILLFVLICRLLRNSFAVWNTRLQRVLLKGEDKFRSSEKIVDRTEFSLLFKDHVCILDLLEGADALFANIIESYYASQICSIIFEVYYFYRSQGSEEFQGARRLDGLIITLYLIHSLAILVVVSLAAAEVGEVAMDGLAVLRQRGMMGSMSDDELYFIMSMYTSYTGHFETALSGGGYFSLDKGFLVTIVGTVFSYFIILLQFSPSLIITKSIDPRVGAYNTSILIRQVEETQELFSKLKVGY